MSSGFAPIGLRHFIAAGAACAVSAPSFSYADAPVSQSAQAAATKPQQEAKPLEARRGEAEFLVPPGGGAFEVKMHARAVTIISFPEEISAAAKASSLDFEVKPWEPGAVAVRATENAQTSTLALATKSGSMRINLTLRVVPESEEGLTMVRFKPVSSEEAVEARVAAELRQQLAPAQAALAEAQRRFDERVQEKAEALIIERALKRNETSTLRAHERNEDAVIVHVRRTLLLGDDGFLFFDIENRGATSYRLATAKLSIGGKALPVVARLGNGAAAAPNLVGVVPARTTVRGVMVLRGADPFLSKSLTLDIAGPQGRGAIRISEGISLK